MKRIFLLLLVYIHLQTSAQQAFWSNAGALVSIKDKAYLSINGDAYNSLSGIYNNTDSIFVTGDWTNDAGNRAFDSIGAGYVFLYANNDQRIMGKDETHFHNLVLKTGGVKYADLDAYVDGTLYLNDLELNADTNTIIVTNPDTASVQRTTGFLSSLEDGGLLRYTTAIHPYLFPVGSNFGISRYRPVTIEPVKASLNYYKARFANVDATTEGFDRDKRFHLVCEINPDWYHRLYHPLGADSAVITIFYDTIADGSWSDIAHWQNKPQWESIDRTGIIAGAPFNRIYKVSWNNYNYSPFALANTSLPFAIAYADTTIWRFDTINVYASGGSTYTWLTDNHIADKFSPTASVWPDSNFVYTVLVEDGKGCNDTARVKITVIDKPFDDFFIPNVITPNGDAYNDTWYIRDLDRYPENQVRIINRWGDEVFFQRPYANNWNGTWKGNELPGATYYYIIRINFNGQDKEFNGPLTVVR